MKALFGAGLVLASLWGCSYILYEFSSQWWTFPFCITAGLMAAAGLAILADEMQ